MIYGFVPLTLIDIGYAIIFNIGLQYHLVWTASETLSFTIIEVASFKTYENGICLFSLQMHAKNRKLTRPSALESAFEGARLNRSDDSN